jgi:chemotaxis protein CheZ
MVNRPLIFCASAAMNGTLSQPALQEMFRGAQMPIRRKIFRIEQMYPVDAGGETSRAEPMSESQCREILQELDAQRDLIERRMTAAPPAARQRRADKSVGKDIDALSKSIGCIAHELAALQSIDLGGPPPARVIRELVAVADGAERAIQCILDAAEDIEDAANSLSASLKREQERALALDIRDHVLRIFEACNFQDLGGQRIAKVLATLKFVEERFANMMEIWSGLDALKGDIASEDTVSATTLHGPKLDHDCGHASQEEIDRLLATG